MRKRPGVRLFVLLAMLGVVIVATGCSFRLSQIEVDNQTNDTIAVADSQLSCKDQPKLSELNRHDLAPGDQRKVFVVNGGFTKNSCIFVGDTQGRVAEAEIQHSAIYSVRNNGAALQIESTGQETGGVDFSLSGPPTWFLLIFVAPLAAGALFALWVTFSFFYGYYAQGKR